MDRLSNQITALAFAAVGLGVATLGRGLHNKWVAIAALPFAAIAVILTIRTFVRR